MPAVRLVHVDMRSVCSIVARKSVCGCAAVPDRERTPDDISGRRCEVHREEHGRREPWQRGTVFRSIYRYDSTHAAPTTCSMFHRRVSLSTCTSCSWRSQPGVRRSIHWYVDSLALVCRRELMMHPRRLSVSCCAHLSLARFTR